MDFPRPHAAFEDGYLTACEGRPRQVPATLTATYPVLSLEWCRGYDDAESDDAAMRAWMVEGFGVRLAA